jgi:hypothetical protein
MAPMACHSLSSRVRLEQVKAAADNSRTAEAVAWFTNYIGNNKNHIVDYHKRKIDGLIFRSQTAEDTANNFIIARQKNQQMRWSRDGAHSVIQISTSDYRKKWNEDRKLLNSHIYKNAA